MIQQSERNKTFTRGGVAVVVGGGGLASDTRNFDLLLGRNLHTTPAFKINLRTTTTVAFKQQKTEIYIYLTTQRGGKTLL